MYLAVREPTCYNLAQGTTTRLSYLLMFVLFLGFPILLTQGPNIKISLRRLSL